MRGSAWVWQENISREQEQAILDIKPSQERRTNWKFLMAQNGTYLLEKITAGRCSICGACFASACFCTLCEKGLCIICSQRHHWKRGNPEQRCCPLIDATTILLTTLSTIVPLLGCQKAYLRQTCRALREGCTGEREVCCLAMVQRTLAECDCVHLQEDLKLMIKASLRLNILTREFERVPLDNCDHRWKYDAEVTAHAEIFAMLLCQTNRFDQGLALHPTCGLFVLAGNHDRYNRWVTITATFDEFKKQYLTTRLSDRTQQAIIRALSFSIAGVEFDLLHMFSPVVLRMWTMQKNCTATV